MKVTDTTLSPEEAGRPTSHEPDAEVRAWQDRKIKAGLADADAGRFATAEAVKAVVRKFVPNG